jgi:hypothetical protein
MTSLKPKKSAGGETQGQSLRTTNSNTTITTYATDISTNAFVSAASIAARRC